MALSVGQVVHAKLSFTDLFSRSVFSQKTNQQAWWDLNQAKPHPTKEDIADMVAASKLSKVRSVV